MARNELQLRAITEKISDVAPILAQLAGADDEQPEIGAELALGLGPEPLDVVEHQ